MTALRGARPSGALPVDAEDEGTGARDAVAAGLPVLTTRHARRTELRTGAGRVRRRAPAATGSQGRARGGLRLRAARLPHGAARPAAPARAHAERIAARRACRDARVVDAAASATARDAEAASLPWTAAVARVEAGLAGVRLRCVVGRGRARVERRARVGPHGPPVVARRAGDAGDAAAAAREKEHAEEHEGKPHGRGALRLPCQLEESGFTPIRAPAGVPGRACQGSRVVPPTGAELCDSPDVSSRCRLPAPEAVA